MGAGQVHKDVANIKKLTDQLMNDLSATFACAFWSGCLCEYCITSRTGAPKDVNQVGLGKLIPKSILFAEIRIGNFDIYISPTSCLKGLSKLVDTAEAWADAFHEYCSLQCLHAKALDPRQSKRLPKHA